MNKLIDTAKQAFNYRIKDDGVPHMQVKEFLAIVALATTFIGGCAYVGNNLPSIMDWFENLASMDEEQGATTSSVPKKNLG